MRVWDSLPFTWGGEEGTRRVTATAGHGETQLVSACHWGELVLPPCCAGGNFAAAGHACEHETFKYL